MANVIHLSKRKTIKTEQAAYSDNIYESAPFTCEAELSNQELSSRISNAIYKYFPPSHFGGCGYSCSLREVNRETPTSGTIVFMHYHGIGD